MKEKIGDRTHNSTAIKRIREGNSQGGEQNLRLLDEGHAGGERSTLKGSKLKGFQN